MIWNGRQEGSSSKRARVSNVDESSMSVRLRQDAPQEQRRHSHGNDVTAVKVSPCAADFPPRRSQVAQTSGAGINVASPRAPDRLGVSPDLRRPDRRRRRSPCAVAQAELLQQPVTWVFTVASLMNS